MLNFLLHFISSLVINEEMDTLDIFILRFSIRIRIFILQNSTSFMFIFKSILAALILLFIALIFYFLIFLIQFYISFIPTHFIFSILKCNYGY